MKKTCALLIFLIMLPLIGKSDQPVDIRMIDAQKGIISMINNFPARNLSDCGVFWILLENGHMIEIVEINNLVGEPNSTVDIELPYASKPFRYGGERWARMEIRNEKGGANANNEILAWEQFPLPEKTSPPPRNLGVETMPAISLSQKNNDIRLSNNLFSVTFNNKTGLIDSLMYYDFEKLLQGPALAIIPSPESLDGKLLKFENSQAANNKVIITTIIQYNSADGHPQFEHTANYNIFGDGTIQIDNTVRLLNEDQGNSLSLSWIGLKMSCPAITSADWYGSLSEKRFCKNRPGSPIEVTKIKVSDLSGTDGTSGPITNLRWLGLTDKFCRGVFFGNVHENLSANISINENNLDLLIGKQFEQGNHISSPISFSIRLRRYDTILNFGDKLWYVNNP